MYYCVMVRLYYKLRYNEDTEVFEMYDPHNNKSVAHGETLGLLKLKDNDMWEYFPILEEDIIQLIYNDVIVYSEYDVVAESHEIIGGKIVFGWNDEEYLKSVIKTRCLL